MGWGWGGAVRRGHVETGRFYTALDFCFSAHSLFTIRHFVKSSSIDAQIFIVIIEPSIM